MDSSRLPAWARVALLALQPIPGWDTMFSGVFGAGVVAVLITAAMKLVFWPLSSVLVACLVMALTFWAALRLQRGWDAACTPHLVFSGDVGTATGQVVERDSQGRVLGRLTGPGPTWYNVFVSNNPPLRMAPLTNAIVELAFFEADSGADASPVLVTDGRWAGNPQPSVQAHIDGGMDAVNRRDLPASSEEHMINVALHHPGDQGFYAASSRVFLADTFRAENLRLPGLAYRVSVTVRAERLPGDVVDWFEIRQADDGITWGHAWAMDSGVNEVETASAT